MTTAQHGLGRGLDALFQSHREQGGSNEATSPRNISIGHIVPNPLQPRKRFEEESLQELAQSIRQQGVLQPILVRPDPCESGTYQIIAGERRWRAATLADFETIPAIIQDISDSQSLIIGLVENLQREDLNPMEEAEALEALQQELNLSQEALSRKIGKSRPSISNCLRLLQLDESMREAIRTGTLSAGAARTLLGITDTETRRFFFEYILKHKTSVRQIESAVGFWKKHGKLPDSIMQGRQRAAESEPPFFEHLKHHLASKLKQQASCRVSISGTSQQGRITLSYRSENELNGILEHFGITPVNVSRET